MFVRPSPNFSNLKRSVTQALPKEERLRGKLLISRLLKEGSSFAFFPVRCVWSEVPGGGDTADVRVLFTVPRRHFASAVLRNGIKRRMREAYRKHKATFADLVSAKGKKIVVFLIYTGKEESGYNVIEGKIILILQRLIKKHQGNGAIADSAD